MQITKELKNVTFVWDEDTKSFNIWTKDGEVFVNRIELSRTEAQSFSRFVFRIIIRYFYPKKYLKRRK